jgi:hypothetical protein
MVRVSCEVNSILAARVSSEVTGGRPVLTSAAALRVKGQKGRLRNNEHLSNLY